MSVALIASSPKTAVFSTSGTSSPISPAVTIPIGSTIVIVASWQAQFPSVSVSDGTSNVYVKIDQESTGVPNSWNMFTFICLNTTAQLTTGSTITVTSTVTGKNVVSMTAYSGAGAYGNLISNTPTGSPNPTTIVTASAAGNFVIACFGDRNSVAFAALAGDGTFETSGVTSGGASTTNTTQCIVDKATLGAGSITLGVTYSVEPVASFGFELQVPPPASGFFSLPLLGVGK